ncbi:MAG: phosphoenolpyruvate synthase [Candidatus Yonathbacteria bacterium CG_4_10_14_3_um_filter_47_65]|uniref:Phosphoenolpyruvate synthase n=2 Tax=Parcubacteria group TaxID=1794811 RepID=A0A2M8D9J7_9BACT|nr:MAG: phosphoenolpyruvate synthase [Candidatus Nomurabacteria bacterium CG1_02_47_685]PIP04105.1 MAG: phosphoenolpyruvate synthase [Candidatus Yonathbacteria bacterium CG23_combo_of_CG06-09_8_20_14_all_46_18]PIQ32667.1 MAG: phosphoenolpyruvate synthase [Candidatus Yonathbacteria bacterium CG17_big_fil_post_rev_8_21_14_2_50_46_19]PIX56660.1 MAG: phosphoenolpyruvate synthase [Candidatus Yonathbacteria bacterium CG_4_10_14_3_um_filter_47_65]PIY57833.1 MAG: phosphoenolpyruvate synthase [Candidatu
MQEDKTHKTILWLDQISNNDVSMVGGKNASLGEMYNTLISQGIRIPNAFVVTAHAYRRFINESKLAVIIHKELAGLDTNNIKALQKKGKVIRAAFLEVNIPKDMEEEIRLAYRDLSSAYRMKGADVAVRSSATAEDLPGASFAGEHETFLNITGEQAVLDAIRAAMASLFTDRAISYRVDKGFDHFDVALSVGVQKMVRSDKGASGVMFTLDTETGFRNVIEISSSWGLGEMVVQGKVTPDEFIVFKPALNEGFPSIIKKSIGAKRRKMIYQDLKISPVKEVDTTTAERNMQSITDEEALTLARWGILIERHYTKRAGPGHESPMDMEWAKDGVSGDLFIVQARPETVQSEKKGFEIVEYRLKEEGEKIIEGISVGTAIVSGRARVILSTKKLSEFKNGEILITEITDPDWEPVMKKSAAIITEKGGRTSHAAIVSRELGIPAVIGVGDALSHIKTGDMITVDCSSGSVGKVYRGKLRFERRSHNLSEIPKVRTTLALNVGSPEGAFVHSFLPHKGVGLAREEFIIASQIRIHPLALINFSTIKDKALKRKIENLTIGYSDKKEFFVEKLAEGIAQIAAAFWPHQVIVRFSDFKTNEYRALIGGDLYEPQEENPMLGWRGASRYAHPNFKPAFALECAAVKRVRERFGLKNLNALIPFCRTPEEGQKVLSVMSEFGLDRGADGFKVYVMCEIPTNVIRASDFLDIFDGFSIGSNDLAQLTLGLDRDSALVAPISNENDPAVRSLVAQAIIACKERGKYIGFCGQAPSDYPDFLRFLISQNIDSVSLNPDSIVAMTFEVAKEEGNAGGSRA